MIDIYIGSDRLDLIEEDIQFHFSSMLFSGKLIDDYSIDFEIPRTRNNERILNPTGALYREQIFGRGIPCIFVTPKGTENAILQVDSFTEKTITIAVFKEVIPDELMKAKLADIIHDDTTTILDYPSALIGLTPPQPTTDCGLFPFDMGKLSPQLGAGYYFPSIRIDKVFRMLTSATGITFPRVDERLYLTATSNKYCPYDKYHYIYLARIAEDSVKLIDGGSAITSSEQISDLKGRSYVVTYNHPAIVTANVEAFAGFTGGIPPHSREGAMARIYRVKPDGTEILIYELKTTTSAKYITGNHEFAVSAGEKIKYENVNTVGISVYDNTATFLLSYNVLDRDKYEFNKDPMPYNLGETPSDIPQLRKRYFNRFGTISNLNEITIKDLLTSICWQLGKKISLSNNLISFIDINDEKKINADIFDYSPISNALGIETSITDASKRVLIKKAFSNDFLNKKKELYKSAFFYAKSAKGRIGINIPIFTLDEDANFVVEDVDGVPISISLIFGINRLMELQPMPNAINALRQFGKVLEIEATTFDDIRGYRYVTIDGLKFAVIEGDYDVKSGQTTFTALQVYDEVIAPVEEDYLLFDNGDKAKFDDNSYIKY